jgi:cobalt-zinc-cadmium efflux system outer membrane protein
MPIVAFNRIIAFGCLSLAAIPVRSTAQAVPVRLTLADAISAAWRASPDARAAEYAVAAAAGRTRQAGARLNPSLAWSREQTSGTGVRNHEDIVAVEQRLELGGLRGARVASATARENAAEARLSALRAHVAFETARAYVLAASAKQQLQLADRAQGVFARAVNVSTRQLAAGDVSGYANRRIRLEAARYATVRATAQLDARAATLALAALVAGHTDSISRLQFHLVDSAVVSGDSPSVSIDSLVALALHARGDIRALAFEEAAAEAEARAAAAVRIPQPAITLGFKSERTAGDVSGSGLVLGFSLPVPLWDRRSGEISAATADVSRRSAELLSLKRRVAREVVEAYEALKAAEVALAPLRDELGESAQRSLNAIQVAWSEGEIPLVEWLDAVRAYQEAEATAISLRAQLMIRRAALDQALGLAGPLTDVGGAHEETSR